METGNLSFLKIDTGFYIHKAIPAKKDSYVLGKLWKKIYSQHIEKFGFSESFQEITALRIKIAKLKIKRVTTGDTGFTTLINVEEFKLNKILEEKNDTTFEDLVIMVKKYLGYDMNLRTTSVLEFFTTINTIQKQTKRNAKRK